MQSKEEAGSSKVDYSPFNNDTGECCDYCGVRISTVITEDDAPELDGYTLCWKHYHESLCSTCPTIKIDNKVIGIA